VEINKVAETEIFIEDRVKSLQEVKDWWWNLQMHRTSQLQQWSLHLKKEFEHCFGETRVMKIGLFGEAWY
jgi:hypothetical protein